MRAEEGDGLLVLVEHLLEHCSLPADARSLARTLLLTRGLRPLQARSLKCGGRSKVVAPLAFWRKEEDSVLELIILDIRGDAGDAAIEIPRDALGGDDSHCFAVIRHRSSAGVSTAAKSHRLYAPPPDGAPAIFSVRELMRQQLHVCAPPQGLTSYRVLPASTMLGDDAARIERAHLCSSLLRLSCRTREYALGNDAVAVLRDCICGRVAGGHAALRLRQLFEDQVREAWDVARRRSAVAHED
jgi:hypothetical protein